MLKRLILIVALVFVLPACSKDDKKASEKPKTDHTAAKATAASAADTTPTPVAPDPKAKAAAAEPAEEAVADDDKGKKPAGGSEDKVEIDEPAKAGDCVAECVQANQMRAVGADQIEADCKAECAKTDKCVTDCVKRNQMRATAPEQIDADCKKECTKK